MNTRRQFLITAPLGVLAATSACSNEPAPSAPAQTPATGGTAATPAGMPPAFGTGPVTGPEVTPATFAEAEKLMQVTMRPLDREVAATAWPRSLAPLFERRTGPRRVPLADDVAPAMVWTPSSIDRRGAPSRDRFVRSAASAVPLPTSDADIAYAPVTQLSRWIERKQLTSDRLTRIYLQRIEALDPKIRAVITPTHELALKQAAQADSEIAAGRYRGPLHGVPYGVKDLLDTAGIPTTYGAEPFRNRVPAADSAVVKRLTDAGAVLVAKLSLGALALNDIWFGGQTMNPWVLEEGASGSSAGPGAATAAALVGFSIGSETGGSIIAPAMRCGVTGLRPTFGRVPRTGAMALCWSLDKVGPMCRSVEDTAIVLSVLNGYDPADRGSIAAPFSFDAGKSIAGMKLGYLPEAFEDAEATDVDRAALEAARGLGIELVPVTLPDLPYGALMNILYAEAAAAFEELTLSNLDDTLTWQDDGAWPNTFRKARFLSAVDHVQLDRLRYRVMQALDGLFSEVDALIGPFMTGPMLIASNFTGHPCLHMRAGFIESGTRGLASLGSGKLTTGTEEHGGQTFRVPQGISLWGRLFEEGPILNLGIALEKALNVAGERPRLPG